MNGGSFMANYEIDENIFNRNSKLKTGIINLCIMGAAILVAVGTALYFYEELFEGPASRSGNSEALPIFVICLFVAFICAIFGITYTITGAVGKRRVRNFVDNYGEDKMLRELQNPLYVFGRKKPYTIITKNYIFEVERGFIETKSIDVCYGYSYKGNTSIHSYSLTNHKEYFCSGIGLRSDDIKQVFAAIRSVNPDLLIGYTSENMSEHRRRVKEYCAGNYKPNYTVFDEYSNNVTSSSSYDRDDE